MNLIVGVVHGWSQAMSFENKTVLANFDRALRGAITLADFQKEWPLDNNDEVHSILYEDLEDAITHTPGFVQKKDIDYGAWIQQYERGVILCDLMLLPFSTTDKQKWTSARKHILKNVNILTEENIREEIKTFFT